jgi:hypothetical protein
MAAANEYTFPTRTDPGNGVAPHRPGVRSRSSASERITNSPDALSLFFGQALPDRLGNIGLPAARPCDQ